MRIHRAVLVALLIGIAPVVAGCADGFDPDKLDFLGLNKKKPLPGERHALFPGGVPGVQQGIPAEYMKGNVAQQQQPGAAVPIEPLKPEEVQPAQTAEKATEEKPKPKPKKRVAAKPKPVRVNVSQQPAQQPAQAAAPWPASAPAQQPAQQAGSPWPNEQQPAPAPWPSAPPPGTFSKQ